MKRTGFVLSISYGKDSLACLGAIEQLGLPLDKIVHADVWATDTIPADLPPVTEFKAQADAIIKARYGFTVEHIRSPRTAEECFYRQRGSGSRAGEIIGWPLMSGCYLQSRLKLDILRKAEHGRTAYIGIAADEPKRFHQLSDRKRSPLVIAGWTEEQCRAWCAEAGLLSPIYSTMARSGCWFCPNQSTGQLRFLRKNYPNLWGIMLKWDADSPVPFRHPPRGRSVRDYDRRFELEDRGVICPDDPSFRWSKMDALQRQESLW